MRLLISAAASAVLGQCLTRNSLLPILSKGYFTHKKLYTGDSVVEFDGGQLQKYCLGKHIAITEEAIRQEFLLISTTVARQVGEANVKISLDDRKAQQAITQIGSVRSEQNKVVLRDDLSVISGHPRFDQMCKAWSLRRSGSSWNGTLSFPFFAEDDIEAWQNHGLTVQASSTALNELGRRVSAEESIRGKAAIHRVGDKLCVEYHNSHIVLERELLSLAKINYFVKQNESQPLDFARKEKTGKILFEEFMLPAVCAMLRSSGITNISGMDELFPHIEEFSFTCNLVKNLRLRTVQEEAFTAWNKNGFGTIVLPTGSGKTMEGLKAITTLKKPTLIVVPSLEIQDHWKSEILQWTTIPEDQIGIFSGEKKEIRPITIITYQSGYRIFSEDTEVDCTEFLEQFEELRDKFHLLIMEEGHHSPSQFYRKIMMGLRSPKRMSLTATAEREDGNESLSFLACGPVVYRTDYVTLARQGLVCPIQYEKVKVSLDETETELVYNLAKLRGDLTIESARLKLKNLETNAVEEEKAQIRRRIKELTRNIPFNSIEPEPSYRIAKRKVFGYAVNKLLKTVEIIRKHRSARIIIFNQLRKGTRVIQKFLADHGISTEILHGGSGSRQKRREVFADFFNGRNSILVTTTVLDEGVNVPGCDVGIVLNGSGTKLQMTQRVGRVGRPGPLKIGYFYEIVATVDPSMYKPQYNDCKRFSDVSTFELKISEARDISGPLQSEAMQQLIKTALIKRERLAAQA